MPKYYSPDGNIEVWDEKPEGYFTVEEWAELHPAPPAPEPTVDEKIAILDQQFRLDQATIMEYFTQAIFDGDTEAQEELKEEMEEIKATYVEERKKLEEE